jgi:hypothetical protein
MPLSGFSEAMLRVDASDSSARMTRGQWMSVTAAVATLRPDLKGTTEVSSLSWREPE